MMNLLYAGLVRIMKSRIFWFGTFMMAFLSFWFCFYEYSPYRQQSADPVYTEEVYFNLLPYIGIFLAVLISMTAGKEVSMGILRNKLIAGHTRSDVYFSHLILGMGITAVLLMIHFITSGICCHIFFLPTRFSVGEQLLCALTVISGSAVYTSLFNLIAINLHRLSSVSVLSLLSSMYLMQRSSRIHNALSESRLVAGEYIVTSNRAYYELVINPYYPTGWKRTLLEFLQDLLPTGQLTQIMAGDLSSAWCWPILSVLLAAGFSLAGYLLFRTKNIR